MMTEINKEYFATALRSARQSKQLTIDQVAEAVHKSRNTIAQMEGAERFTSIPTLIDLCNLYDVSPNYLLSGYLKNDTRSDFSNAQSLLASISNLRPGERRIVTGLIQLLINNRRE